jgi:hypothetical protein
VPGTRFWRRDPERGDVLCGRLLDRERLDLVPSLELLSLVAQEPGDVDPQRAVHREMNEPHPVEMRDESRDERHDGRSDEPLEGLAASADDTAAPADRRRYV